MADPVSLAIATAIAGKTAESLADQAKQSLAALARLIREKFRDRLAASAALAAAADDPGAVGELAHALDEACAQDPEFGRQVRVLWSRISDDGVVNIFHGHAGKVVQLRDVHGDLHIG